MKETINRIVGKLGYTIEKVGKQSYPDLDTQFDKLYEIAKSQTMTSIERMYSLYNAIKYIVAAKIEGDIVECGVWKGGSSMMAALTLQLFNDTSRRIFLYDTYEGMSNPTEKDISFTGEHMKDHWSDIKKEEKVFCYSTLEEVQSNLYSTGYPKDKFVFIKGKVEDTIPSNMPDKIAVLRLDTDWYESTYHELKYLYPLLADNGVLIIDDYGHWKGAREAVDQYFSENRISLLLNRIDYTGRLAIKH